jgi:hypothetical protein
MILPTKVTVKGDSSVTYGLNALFSRLPGLATLSPPEITASVPTRQIDHFAVTRLSRNLVLQDQRVARNDRDHHPHRLG